MNPQTKPAHKPTYRERVLAGQVKPKPRSRIKPVAKRKQSRDAEYRKWVERAMGKVIRCERCHFGRGFARLEPHHPFGRQGENLFKVTPLCSICHAWCHETPNTAYVAGWLQPEYRGVQRQPGHPQPFTLLP